MNEANNTMNILANKPALITSAWCKVGIHNYQKWSKPILRCEEGMSSSYQSIQERFCQNCNKHNVRRTRNVKEVRGFHDQ